MRNAAVNLSDSQTGAELSHDLYCEAQQAWDPKSSASEREYGRGFVTNYARAFHLDPGKILSPNPSISGPERARFQTQLLAQVDAAGKGDPQLDAARNRYTASVHQAAQDHVSVVVSAGNEGRLAAQLPGTRALRARPSPPTPFQNVLETPETFNVGAVENGAHGEQVADYSNPSPLVHNYAAGGGAPRRNGRRAARHLFLGPS